MVFLFLYENTIDMPTMNKKNGNTKSVGVYPCHGACKKGVYTADQVPGVLTSIMSKIVAPRKISTDSILFANLLIFLH